MKHCTGRLLLPFLLVAAYPEAMTAYPSREAANETITAPAIMQQRKSMTVTGKVIGKEDGQPVPFVNVMLKEKDASGIIDYTLTGDDGAYTLKYGGNADSVMVTVSGFNITEKSVMLPFGDAEYNFMVSTGALELKEVRVSYEPVKRRRDTISYKVESFISGADRNIGDVLRKMPGIEVKTSGKILYNGKEIDRFYIEGMDMLRSRYGVATNTVKANDVEFVEVLENNQHIKALADRKLDGKTALNLKLKESSKGTWGGTATVGVGYSPFLWNAEAAALFFGRRFQSINTYKTNNEGLDVSKENFDREAISPLLDGVSSPAEPPIDENRYLKNNIHSVSLNTITKLDSKNFLRADVQYAHDERSAEGKSERLYHFPDGTGMEITELISNSMVDDKVSAGIDFESNSEKMYIKEQFSFSGLWNSDRGRVLNGGQDIMQKFSFPDINAENNVSGFFNRNRWRWSFNSTTGYSSRPAVFRTSPLVTDGIFGGTAGTAATGAVQDFKSSEFYTSNSAGTSYRLERWYFHVNASLNFRTSGFTSALTPLYGDSGTSGSSGSTADPGFSNDIRTTQGEIRLSPGVTYGLFDRFSATVSFSGGARLFMTDDRITGGNIREYIPLIRPVLSVKADITTDLKFTANALYDMSGGSMYNNYSGYIMSDYRTVSRKESDVFYGRMQNYNAELSYANAFNAIFASLGATWWKRWSNITFGTRYEGDLSIIEAVPEASSSEGYDITGKFSKRLFAVNTTLTFSPGYSSSLSGLFRQGEFVNIRWRKAYAGFSFNSELGRWGILAYDITSSGNFTEFGEGDNDDGTDSFISVSQKCNLDIMAGRKVVIRLGGEHYYNDAIAGNRNMFFADASVSWSIGSSELIIEGRNILNTREYRSVEFSDITTYYYSCALRPWSVMAKIRFNF